MIEDTVREEEINLLDLLLVIAKRKGLIIIKIIFGVAIITAIISLILTLIYKAETKILPPQTFGAGLASQLISQMAGGLDVSALGGKTPADLYIGMLSSNTVVDKIISSFNIMQEEDFDYKEDARNFVLKNITNFSYDKKSGIITIAVQDKDPKRAADMANAFVEELKNLNKGLAITEASQRRLYYEEQLKDTKDALIKAENEMKSFQEKTGALQIDEQSKAIIGGIADLKAKVAAKEVELKVLRSFATPQNPDYQRVEEELKALRNELKKLEADEKGGHDPIMPTGRIPSVVLEYFRKLREVKFKETLYEFLLKQYELAKLDEARDAVLIQVIDKATPPDKRFKPKRGLMVIIATFSALFISISLCFILEFYENIQKNDENRERMEKLKRYLKIKQ
jgi:tyrosine-protein kinase Etk/Wzc